MVFDDLRTDALRDLLGARVENPSARRRKNEDRTPRKTRKDGTRQDPLVRSPSARFARSTAGGITSPIPSHTRSVADLS